MNVEYFCVFNCILFVLLVSLSNVKDAIEKNEPM